MSGSKKARNKKINSRKFCLSTALQKVNWDIKTQYTPLK